MKIAVFFILVLLATLLGGIYGALYDQLTYSISPEFFYQVRFEQMHFLESDGRWGAAKAGFIIVCKVGLLLGGILAGIGFIHRNGLAMFRTTLEAFIIAIGGAFVFSLLGWMLGPELVETTIPEGVKDSESFFTVIRMNNFSYMGGIAGMLLGILWHVYRRKRDTFVFSTKKQPGE